MDALKNTLHIRERLQSGLSLNDTDTDREGRRFNAVLINDLGQKFVVGTTLGAPKGQRTFMAIAFDVDPGTYRLEIWKPNKPLLFPKGHEQAKVNVYSTQADN